MKNRKYFLPIILLAILSSIFAYKLSYYIGENFFFDKLFYKKSIAHGYQVCEPAYCEYKRYGKRAEDIAELLKKDFKQSKSVLGKTVDDPFTIAIIGDSYVWGLGVKDNKTLSALLAKKLNKIKKTKVFQLGFPGDGALDNLAKNQLISQEQSIDLYIFVINENDILPLKGSIYAPEHYKQIINLCSDSDNNIIYNYNEVEASAPGFDYRDLLEQSYENPQNKCILSHTVSLYPKNAIYFNPLWKVDETNSYYEVFSEYLKREGLYVLNLELARNKKEYSKYWQNPKKYFQVSEIETHPSVTANQVYTETLYEEIINNQKWGFTK